MTGLRARLALFGYRWAGVAAYPAVGAFVSLRAARGKEERARKSERKARYTSRAREALGAWMTAI